MTECYRCGATASSGAVVYLPKGVPVARVLCAKCSPTADSRRCYAPRRIPDRSEIALEALADD